ncbi:MAG: adenine phosphoribosyltransferase [Verrucomicrobia bacterium]|nr:adenine phosphoribosyltransferase [Verrucomicrobiota bacterium]
MSATAIAEIKAAIRDIPNFPKPPVVFKDITPVLQQPKLFRAAVDVFVDRHSAQKPNAIVGIDARGFIFAGAVAYQLGVAFVPVRKKGKLPYKTIEESYDLEYGRETLSMHIDAVKPGERVVIVDDVLATGGTAATAAKLVEQLGGKVAECDFLIELKFLAGAAKLAKYQVFSAVSY